MSAASETPGPGEGDLRGEAEYPRQRKGLNPFLPDAPVRKTFTDERVIEAAESWSADQRMREGWRDGDTNTYRYRANLLDALCVRLRAAVEQRTLAEQKVADLGARIEALTRTPVYATWPADGGLTGEANAVQSWRIRAVLAGGTPCSEPRCQYVAAPGKTRCDPHSAALADPEADRGGTTKRPPPPPPPYQPGNYSGRVE